MKQKITIAVITLLLSASSVVVLAYSKSDDLFNANVDELIAPRGNDNTYRDCYYDERPTAEEDRYLNCTKCEYRVGVSGFGKQSQCIVTGSVNV